jgi:hypothetical protein
MGLLTCCLVFTPIIIIFFLLQLCKKERKEKEINTLPSSLFFSVCKCQRGGGGLYGGGATGVRNFSSSSNRKL